MEKTKQRNTKRRSWTKIGVIVAIITAALTLIGIVVGIFISSANNNSVNNININKDESVHISSETNTSINSEIDEQIFKGQFYFDRHDYATSMEWYERAANNKGNTEKRALALNNIAYMFSLGLGVEPNSEQAIKFYTDACGLNYPMAIKNLAALYMKNPYTAGTFDAFLNSLKSAYNIGDEQTKKFVAIILSEDDKGDQGMDNFAVSELSKKFFCMSADQQKEALQDKSVWSYERTIESEYTIGEYVTNFEKVVYRDLSLQYSSDEPYSAPTCVYNYKQYHLIFEIGDHSLADDVKEEFASLN